MTSLRLTYVPVPGSHHVYLNSIEMREGTDWVDDGTGLLTFLGPMAEASGDLIECRYAHDGRTFAEPEAPAEHIQTSVYAIAGPGSISVGGWTVPAPGVAAGDSLIVEVSCPPHTTPNVPTGLGATWYRIADVVGGGTTTSLFIATGCDGVGQDVTISRPAGGANGVSGVMARVTHRLDPVTAQAVTRVGAGSLSLNALNDGIAILVYRTGTVSGSTPAVWIGTSGLRSVGVFQDDPVVQTFVSLDCAILATMRAIGV